MARKMKDSGIEWIGEIPEGWEIQKLKYYATVASGEILSRDEYNFSGDIPVIGSNGKIGTTYKSNNHSEVITTGRVGTIGTAQIVQDAWITDNALIIKSHSINRPFLTYVIPNFDFKFMLSGTAQPLITATKLKNQYIPVPSSEVQDKLVQYLNTQIFNLSHLISQACSSIELYKKLKQAVITQAVTKGVRGEREMKDSGIEWIGKIPKEWKKNKILRIFSTIGSGTTPKSTDNNNFDGNINWLQSGDINGNILKECKNRISFKVLSKYPALKLYHAPFIIIAMYGASIGNLSISIIDGCVNQARCVFSHTSQNFQYMFYCLKTVQPYLIRKAVGGGQPNVSQEILKSLWVPLPPLDEQKEIADYLDAKCAEIDRLIAKKEQLVKELESYKKSLIYEVVTGKREV